MADETAHAGGDFDADVKRGTAAEVSRKAITHVSFAALRYLLDLPPDVYVVAMQPSATMPDGIAILLEGGESLPAHAEGDTPMVQLVYHQERGTWARLKEIERVES